MFRSQVLLFLALVSTAMAQKSQQQTGIYFDPTNREELFSFERTTVQIDSKKTVTVLVKDKKSALALSEFATYENGRLNAYKSIQHQIGVEAEVLVERSADLGGKTQIKYTTKQGDTLTQASERLREPVLSNDELPDFIRTNIETLRKNQSIEFYLILPLRRESMQFELKLERPRMISMRVTSMFVRVFLDPVKFELDENVSPKIVSILGRTPLNPSLDPGGKDLVLNLKFNEGM